MKYSVIDDSLNEINIFILYHHDYYQCETFIEVFENVKFVSPYFRKTERISIFESAPVKNK